MYKLAVLNSHPIQYFAPLYRRIAQEPDIELTVYYCSRQGVDSYKDPGFGVEFKWDIDLLEGYHHKFLPNVRSAKTVRGPLSLINPAITSELSREKHDALWVFGHKYATNMIAVLSSKFLGVPILMRAETHLLLARSRVKMALRRPLMSILYHYFCATCLPIGSLNADFYRHHGIKDERLFQVPYTVDNVRFIEAISNRRNRSVQLKQQYGLEPDLPVILFASKLSSRKNPMHLLKAFQQMREKGTQAQLAFVGSGPEEDALKTLVKQYTVPDVFFLGFRNQTELINFYAIADLFVLPSTNEPWGLVINEAMCGGLPIIASKEIGAVADLVKHGQNGFVFDAGDIEALSSHLDALCKRPDLRQNMGAASLNRIRDWSYEEAVSGIRSALQYVTAR